MCEGAADQFIAGPALLELSKEMFVRGQRLAVRKDRFRMRNERSILVLASSVGGTPVVMQEADSPPSMPLTLMVRGHRSGGADVLIANGGWLDLPAAVADELASLPRLVDRALS